MHSSGGGEYDLAVTSRRVWVDDRRALQEGGPHLEMRRAAAVDRWARTWARHERSGSTQSTPLRRGCSIGKVLLAPIEPGCLQHTGLDAGHPPGTGSDDA